MSDKYVIESIDMTRSHLTGEPIRTIVYHRVRPGDMVKIEIKTSKEVKLEDMNRELELKDIFHEL